MARLAVRARKVVLTTNELGVLEDASQLDEGITAGPLQHVLLDADWEMDSSLGAHLVDSLHGEDRTSDNIDK
ncbi:hypothetical protein BD310DRAFT_805080 [Dichomitus squalens]|uniref:Uncharacterized protein n=1 Tax=Dichomitus squalens TaxID=114155 RepID=A0A4Q9QAF5_9APHY|nr:hypothetical protein BD310DRAFT_805080 [Dichomitus squalens]